MWTTKFSNWLPAIWIPLGFHNPFLGLRQSFGRCLWSSRMIEASHPCCDLATLAGFRLTSQGFHLWFSWQELSCLEVCRERLGDMLNGVFTTEPAVPKEAGPNRCQ